MALQPFVGPWPPLQFRNLFYTVGRNPWTSDQPVARPLPTHKTPQTQNKHTQTSMPRVGFESTIPVFERAKTVHALDRAATAIGTYFHTELKLGTKYYYNLSIGNDHSVQKCQSMFRSRLILK
jgi:hypothetical protein